MIHEEEKEVNNRKYRAMMYLAKAFPKKYKLQIDSDGLYIKEYGKIYIDNWRVFDGIKRPTPSKIIVWRCCICDAVLKGDGYEVCPNGC